jgi:opine dehydrogenase
MDATRVTVLGGGNTAFSLAANFALAGSEVVLWEHPAQAGTIAQICDTRTIHLEGTEQTGTAVLAGVTTDAAEALAWAGVVLMSVPGYAHEPFVDQVVPHLRADQILVLLPGNLGSLMFSRALRDAGTRGVVVAESDTAPYVCRKTGPDRAVIWGRPGGLGIGVHPAERTDEVLPVLRALFPGARSYANVLACGLSSLNPLVHPAGVLLNAGRIERSRGDFYFYEEGVTESVVRVIEAVDAERRALGRALGQELLPAAAAFAEAGFGPAGDLWSVINGSRMLTALRAPGTVASRWLTEDVPYGLVTWASLAAQVGVAVPVTEALITLVSAVLGSDCRAGGRTAADLGLGGLSRAGIQERVERGWATPEAMADRSR